jgi:hypothetical protein
MLFEIVTAGLLVMSTPAGFPKWAAWLGIALVIAIWLSTALLQVPCHNRLMEGFDEVIYRKLVNTNWIRTVFWSARGLLTGYFLLKLMK